jgi:hypothetical protein
MMRSFTQMMVSKDDKIRQAMRWFAENEREFRLIGMDPDSSFLNWKDEYGESGTACLAARTRKAARDLKVQLKFKGDDMLARMNKSEFKNKTAVDLGRFLTQRVIRRDKFAKLVEHKVHGATYTTLKDNEASNTILKNIYTRKSDAFFRFTVAGRADCLPTPVNVKRWLKKRGAGQHEDETHCPRCENERQQTFAHILNECTSNFQMMTVRQNRVAAVVKEAIIKFASKDLRSDIVENAQVQQEGLAEHLQILRPDMVFERQTRGNREAGEKGLDILEFSCPYGYISREMNTLE